MQGCDITYNKYLILGNMLPVVMTSHYDFLDPGDQLIIPNGNVHTQQ